MLQKKPVKNKTQIKVKKVIKGLKKASKTHAKQAKTLQSLNLKKGGSTTKKKSTVNKAGNYTKPTLRKSIFNRIKSGTKGGKAGQWSARKAQMLAKQYKAKGGGYKS
jgi:ribosomal protein L30/L7E|tara:strand:- start:5178 stop:5498 length:321 start_codon:yes stop_codon:yes gene_type:complete